MTSNNRLDRAELHLIFEDGKRQAVELEKRLQAIILKLAAIGTEVEDEHTCQLTLHLGRRAGDVKADVQKRY